MPNDQNTNEEEFSFIQETINPSSVVVLGKFRRFHFFIFPICLLEPRFFPYFQQIFRSLFGIFLLKKFFMYVIIIVLYSTLSGGRLWHTI